MNLETKQYEYTPKTPKLELEKISYQPIKLIKEMEQRTDENKTISGLKRAKGIQVISPDTQFRSVLSDLEFVPGEPTKCDFLIEVSMYNEGVKNFTDTLGGVCSNLADFVEVGISPARIACIIIIDGIRPFYSTYSKQKGFFEQFFIEDMIKDRFSVADVRNCKLQDETEDDEFAHCFMQKITLESYSEYELQLIFCVKHKNKRKLNTHLWFFGGFCEFIQPKFVMLIDVGTMPLEKSLFLLYEAMETQKDLAGCCGEIRPMDPDIWKLVVPAQVVEYRFSHIFDKAFESVLGYITVLPGAFSAYRWEALQGEPLWKDYFKSICHPELMSAFNSNIYLAEDRVLCLALISKKNSSYLIRYVRDSVSETDVPENISSLMAQRRRWINGSWFSLIDSIQKCRLIFQSSHNCCRKCLFSFQMTYYVVNVIFSWLMVGSFFVVFDILVKVAIGTGEEGQVISGATIIILIYFVLLIIVVVMSLGVKPSRVEGMYKIIATIFGIYMMGSFISAIAYIVTQTYEAIVMYAILATFAMFGITVVVTCSVITILKGVFHYLFLTPTYVNVFLIYSICNTHDCSWGNRPDLLSQEEKNRIEEFEEFRIRWVIVWVLCNCSFAFFLNSLGNVENGQWYIYGVGIFGMSIMVFRFLGSVFYIFHEICCKRRMKKSKKIYPSHHAETKPEAVCNPKDFFFNGRNPEPVLTQPFTILEEHPKDFFIKKRMRSFGSESQIKLNENENENIKEGFKVTELNSLEMLVNRTDNKEKPSFPVKIEKMISFGSSRMSKIESINLVNNALNEDKTEEISELSLVLRQKRFQKGIRLTQMAIDVGIPINRLRGIEEGTMIPSQEERKILSYYIINYKE